MQICVMLRFHATSCIMYGGLKYFAKVLEISSTIQVLFKYFSSTATVHWSSKLNYTFLPNNNMSSIESIQIIEPCYVTIFI